MFGVFAIGQAITGRFFSHGALRLTILHSVSKTLARRLLKLILLRRVYVRVLPRRISLTVFGQRRFPRFIRTLLVPEELELATLQVLDVVLVGVLFHLFLLEKGLGYGLVGVVLVVVLVVVHFGGVGNSYRLKIYSCTLHLSQFAT